MVDACEQTDDGRRWTLRLREGLHFHDGEPVRARDCIASLLRWSHRDAMGQALSRRPTRFPPRTIATSSSACAILFRCCPMRWARSA
jgi:ABC-type transport system substrate-binding protein